MNEVRERRKSGIDRAKGLATLIPHHDGLARYAFGRTVRCVLDTDDLHDALFECEYSVTGPGYYRAERWHRRPCPVRRVTVKLRRFIVDVPRQEREGAPGWLAGRWVELGSLRVKPYRWLHDVSYVKRWLKRFARSVKP